jgi:hypothetical protein
MREEEGGGSRKEEKDTNKQKEFRRTEIAAVR